MHKVWTLLVLICLPVWAQEPVEPAPEEAAPNKIYRSVDHQGVVEFSDKPSDNAKEINLPKGQSYAPPPIQAIPAPSPSRLSTESVSPYQTIAITDPINDSTLRDNAGNVPVTISLVPGLIPTHKLELLLDGKPQEVNGGNHVDLTNLDRGAHTLVAQVLDGSGTLIISSTPITFYLLRHFKRPTPPSPPPPPAKPNNNAP